MAVPSPPDSTPCAAARAQRPLLWLAVMVALAAAAMSWFTSRSELTAGHAIAERARPGDVQMLSSVTCPICTRARLFFKTHQVPFSECFIERDDACAARFAATMSPGTPVIVVRGRAQVGFDAQRIVDALAAAAP